MTMTTSDPSIPSPLDFAADAADLSAEPTVYSPLERELIESLRNAEARAAFLSDLDRAVQPIAEPDQVMSITARMLAEHLGSDRCAYAEVEDESIFVITGDFTRDVPSIFGNCKIKSSALGIKTNRDSFYYPFLNELGDGAYSR